MAVPKLSAMLLFIALSFFSLTNAIPYAADHKVSSVMAKSRKDINFGRDSIKRSGPPVPSALFEVGFSGIVVNDVLTFGGSYFGRVTAGSGAGATTYEVLVDTGSALTWLGVGFQGFPVPSSTATGDTAADIFPGGTSNVNLNGPEFTDEISLNAVSPSGAALTLSSANKQQSIIEIDPSSDVAALLGANLDAEGVIGLGTLASSQGTFNSSDRKTVPNIATTLFEGDAITTNQFAVFLVPPASPNVSSIIFGDPLQGPRVWTRTPTTVIVPDDDPHWSFGFSLTYGSGPDACTIVEPAPSTRGFVDTGNPFITLDTAALQQYLNCTGGLVGTNSDGSLSISRSNVRRLDSLFVTINGEKFELTADAQLLPNFQDNEPSFFAAVQNPSFPPLVSGFRASFGVPFHQRVYVLHDQTVGQRLSFAPTFLTQGVFNQDTDNDDPPDE